jgi:serine/threonine protein kinase
LIFSNGGPLDVVAKIADFGLSKYAKRMTSQSEDSSWFSVSSSGSIAPRWTAPEGWNNNFSPKSDVWSFGVVMWELFQSKFAVPYSGISNDAILLHIMRGNRLQQPALCPDNVWDVVKCCWMLNPTERPTFRELSAQFRNFVQAVS